MSATTRRTSATARELQDWRVWAIGGGATVALGYQALQHLGWRAALVAPPLAAASAAGAWAWARQRPAGFAAEATRAIVAQMPDGSRQPRLKSCQQQGAIWEMAWRLRDRSLGRPLLKKAAAIGDALDAEIQMRFDGDCLQMRAGTALVPEAVSFEDFYRHPEPQGELVVGIGESRWGALWADLVLLPHLLVGGTTKFGKSVMVRQHLHCPIIALGTGARSGCCHPPSSWAAASCTALAGGDHPRGRGGGGWRCTSPSRACGRR
jgi:hypothetical protein